MNDATITQPDHAQVAPSIADDSQDVMLPLNRLVVSQYNQRKKPRPPASIEALANNIRMTGLLQNLVVHPMKKAAKKAQTWGVDAGETRRMALLFLAEGGVIAEDFPVRCKVITEAEAIMASAAENDLHVPPHPADQCAAYQALIEEGRSAEFIAALFGTDVRAVQRRLKLANLSPRIMDLWRNDEIETAHVQALALTDDHATQERVWDAAQDRWAREPNRLRAMITQEETSGASSAIARFVGVADFEAAGGSVRRDLFGAESQWWFTDHELMNRLATEKLATYADAVKAEGWKWVEVRNGFPHEERSAFSRIHPQPQPLTDEQREAIAAIEKRQAEIEAAMEDEDLPGEQFDALDTELSALGERYTEICEQRIAFDATDKALAGVLITIDVNGIAYHRGLVRGEDEAAMREAMTEAGKGAAASHLTRSAPATSGGNEKAPRSIHSEKLLMNLTSHRTAAVQCELARNPHIALAVAVHAMLPQITDRIGSSYGRMAEISVQTQRHTMHTHAPELKSSTALDALGDLTRQLRAKMPTDPNQHFAWLIEQDDATLMQLLALCTAQTVNGIDRNMNPHPVNNLIGALGFNMAGYWQPTRESYFDHVSKDRIVEVVIAAVSEAEGKRLAKLKKGQAAAEAETLLKGSGWLPEFMGDPQSYSLPYHVYDADDADDEEREEEEDGEGTHMHTETVPLGDDCTEAVVHAAAGHEADAASANAVAGDEVPEPNDAPAQPSAWPFAPGALPALHRLALQQAA
jgi:ParB family transcriptional regulator, chromosome partitioning protein